MTWNIQQSWDGIRSRVADHWSGTPKGGRNREARIAYLSSHYGISKRDAARCLDRRGRDAGELDDWNDVRSILDM
jgi:hypothetical protein